MLFGYKIVKIEVFGENGALLASVDKGFVFPRNLDSDEESILIIKGRDLPELERGVRVTVIAYSKAGDRIKYLGEISMAHSRQMNVSLQKYRNTQLLEERRRYFKIKVDLKGRVLFLVKGDDTIRFEEPVNIGIQDINVGGIFMSSSYEFMQDDCVCVDVELNETDLDRIAEALSAVKASSIVESVGLELAETEKGRPADVMKCTLHIVLRGEAAE